MLQLCSFFMRQIVQSRASSLLSTHQCSYCERETARQSRGYGDRRGDKEEKTLTIQPQGNDICLYKIRAVSRRYNTRLLQLHPNFWWVTSKEVSQTTSNPKTTKNNQKKLLSDTNKPDTMRLIPTKPTTTSGRGKRRSLSLLSLSTGIQTAQKLLDTKSLSRREEKQEKGEEKENVMKRRL